VVLFGRSDPGAPAADLAYFRSHRLGAESLAYRGSRTIPLFERPPTPVTWIDRIFRNRSLLEPQPHSTASYHWLQGQGTLDPSETGTLPDPAHCFLAIQEARIALARRPDDPFPYRILSEVYRILMLEESALLDGLKLTPGNAEAIGRTAPRTNLLMNRFRQRATALNNAIQTTPYPVTEAERQSLFPFNYQLYQLYLSVNAFDFARDRLQAMLDQAPKLVPEALEDFKRQLTDLNGRIKQVQDQINDQTIEQQLGPLQRAGLARSQGAPGLAIVELEEAERSGISPALVRPQLVDLYCDTGQPEKALELLNTGNAEDLSLGSEPGSAANRQAKVNFLLGNYEYAAQLWENRAITQLRFDRGSRALAASASLLRGQVKPATSMFLDLPGKVAVQASWDFDLGLCRLEMAKPDLAPAPLTEALTLVPDMALRPVAAYYLEKLGQPVPPLKPAAPGVSKDEKPQPKETPKDDEEPEPKKETPKEDKEEGHS
jgi:hypothetical protein